MPSASVSAEEVARFDALASRWWDPRGPMRPLHQMNPARIGWIQSQIAGHFGAPQSPGRRAAQGALASPPRHPRACPGDLSRQDAGTDPRDKPGDDVGGNDHDLHGSCTLRILDVGCGAGLAAEALAEEGHDVLGLDAAGEAIDAARLHAAGAGLTLAYRSGIAEDLLAEGKRFPVITALEVIEHVPDPAQFVAVLAELLEPGGLLILSTLNRTRRSLLTAKLGAEYVLRLLPVGTHDWHRFITPMELGAILRETGLRVTATAGLVPRPLTGGWKIGRDLGVNYLIAATK